MDNPELKVGMVFADREVLKEAIKNYSLQNKYKIRLKFNDKRRVKADCKPSCPWVGKHKSQYSRIYDYLSELRLTNHGTTTVCQLDDRGLVEGLPEVFPIRSIELVATYLREFEVALAEMMALSPKAYEWLVGKDPRNWSKSHFSCNSKCDMLLNNLCESFNKVCVTTANKPIITMLEIIRTKIMQRIAKKKVEADKWSTILCPKIQKKLDATIESSNRCWPTHAGGHKFQISCGPHTQHAVDLSEHTCSCRKWQLTWIPCHHAISAIFLLDQRPDAFVDVCYKTITQQAIYNHMIEPVRGPDQWNPDTTCLPILPPVKKRPPGRPQKNRKKEADEKNDHSRKVGKKGLRMNCSKCGQSGQNVRTCKGVIRGNSQPNRISPVHPQTQPYRGRTVPKLPVKKPFGDIRIQDATTNIPSEQFLTTIDLQHNHHQSL
ncbi:hypothetical protein GQ457_03G014140 [Hibiscus cannabinus]